MLAPVFGKMIAMAGTCRQDMDAIVSVPMHPANLKQRGYDQARLIAQEASKLLNVPLFPAILVRTKLTLPQTALMGAERRRNLSGAFEVKRYFAVAGKRIMLVDDVMTTGATLNECSKALFRSGAASVHAHVVATSRINAIIGN